MPAGSAHILPIPERPWDSIGIDFLGPLPKSGGHKNIMVIVDRFSSFLLCFPLPEKFSAVHVSDIFVQNFYGKYGLPKSIVSDRDSRFTGGFWQALQKALGIELLMATAFHQETNGQVERTNKTIMQMLRIFGNQTGNDWADNLWRAEHAHNFSTASWIPRSPFEMVYGKHQREIPPTLTETALPAVERYLDDLIVQQKIANDALILARFRQAETVNKRRNPSITFQVGNYVTYQRHVKTKTKRTKKTKKLRTIWVGPYIIESVDDSTGNCLLGIPDELRIHPWFAADRLKLYQPRDGIVPPPVNDTTKDEEEYEVDQVLDYNEEKNEYLVS